MSRETHITIGSKGWEKLLRSQTDTLDRHFWTGFKTVSVEEINQMEIALRRDLPEDFRLFLTTFGTGDFPSRFGGGFFSPNEIIEGCAGPILMLIGSDGWASADEQRRFYVTRGGFNPAPGRFTANITKYAGVDLLDLIQIGYDGMSCYYQLICPVQSTHESGFCRITPEGTFEDRVPSFSEGLHAILFRFKERL